MSKVTNGKPIIKFTDLRIYMQNRRVPILPEDVARKTKHFGKSISPETARRFFRGDLSPTAISFHVIKATIEGWDNISIDFKDSPYAESLQPAAVETQ